MKHACCKHARPSFLLLFTPPPWRVPYLFLPIDRGWSIGRRELVCSGKHACVLENLFSLSLDLKLTEVVYFCSFAPDRWSSSASDQRYHCLQFDILYHSLHHGLYRVCLTPPSVTFFLTLSKNFSLYGTITRNIRLLSTYAFHLAWSTGVQAVLDVAQLILFFRESRQTLVQKCLDGSTDTELEKQCNNSFNSSKWTIVICMAVGLIIQFCRFSFIIVKWASFV